jgi:site-specific recombinase XerD
MMHVPYEQVEWHELRAHHVEWIRQALTERDVAPSTVNVTLPALKGIARRARDLNLMTGEEYDRVRDVRGAKGEREPAGRSATSGEIEALVRACLRDRSPAGIRDVALLGVLYIGGIRRAELIGLQLSDYTPEPPTLRVRGKGNKHRGVPLTAAAAAALDDWLRVRGDSEGGLFVPLTKGGAVAGTSMTGQAISKVLLKRVGQAGVEHLSPHDFRRTFIGDLLEKGIDISRVKEMAGHASVDTTARYDRRPEAERRKAVEVLHYPYARRRGWPSSGSAPGGSRSSRSAPGRPGDAPG